MLRVSKEPIKCHKNRAHSLLQSKRRCCCRCRRRNGSRTRHWTVLALLPLLPGAAAARSLDGLNKAETWNVGTSELWMQHLQQQLWQIPMLNRFRNQNVKSATINMSVLTVHLIQIWYDAIWQGLFSCSCCIKLYFREISHSTSFLEPKTLMFQQHSLFALPALRVSCRMQYCLSTAAVEIARKQPAGGDSPSVQCLYSYLFICARILLTTLNILEMPNNFGLYMN